MSDNNLILEEAIFKFSQDGNCVNGTDDCEFLEIKAISSLGIDRDNECFFELRTRKCSIESYQDILNLTNRIEKIILINNL
jgi:hypothetical protein